MVLPLSIRKKRPSHRDECGFVLFYFVLLYVLFILNFVQICHITGVWNSLKLSISQEDIKERENFSFRFHQKRLMGGAAKPGSSCRRPGMSIASTFLLPIFLYISYFKSSVILLI